MSGPLNKTTGDFLEKSTLELYGTIQEELARDDAGFSAENVRILRHHGIFQQDNRDERYLHDGPRCYRFMVRIRATGGKLSTRQLRGLLELTDKHCDGKLHITSRQGIQLAGIKKSALRSVMRSILGLNLTTLATGGNFGCNIMCSLDSEELCNTDCDLQSIADELEASLAPRVQAYDDIWYGNCAPKHEEISAAKLCNGGQVTLPQKFKIGLATASDNCTEVYAQDVGLLAEIKDGRVIGYNVLVGGSMRNSLSVEERACSLAIPLAFIERDNVVPLVESIVEVYRKNGNRNDPGRARLKYLIQDWGIDRFKQAVEERFGKLQPPHLIDVIGHNDHLGWQHQGHDRWSVGIRVENGCIDDLPRQSHSNGHKQHQAVLKVSENTNDSQLKSALREIIDNYDCKIWLTPGRNIAVCDISSNDRTRIDTLLSRYHVPAIECISNVHRFSASCPGLPNCSSAITESHRLLPEIVAELESEIFRLGLAKERFTLRVAGCSFGCTRTQLADIGIVGRTVDPKTKQGKYAIFLGGDSLGQRLNRLFKDLVPADRIIAALRPLLLDYCCQRLPDETLGDFFVRTKI